MKALLFLLLATTTPALGQQNLTAVQRSQILEEAQQSYDRGIAVRRSDPAEAKRLFREAADRFGLVIADGVANGLLEYNQANALLQAGEIGNAIIGYRRADLLRPGEPRIEANLEYARSLRRNRIAPGGQRALLDALLAWHRRRPQGLRFGIFATAYLVFWGVLIAGRFGRSVTWRYAAIAALPVWLAAGASVAADLLPQRQTEGVIVVDDVTVRKGNGDGFAPMFEEPLHQGVEFEIVEQRGPWLKIRLRDGKTGWVREQQAGMV